MVARAAPAQRRAFALVDAIVAAVLLGVSLAVIIGLSGQSISAQARGRDLRLAAMLADEQLNLVLARGPDDYARRFPTSGPCDPPLDRFRYQLDFVSGSPAEPYLVRATITWTTSSRPESLSIETLIAPRTGDAPDPDRTPAQPATRDLSLRGTGFQPMRSSLSPWHGLSARVSLPSPPQRSPRANPGATAGRPGPAVLHPLPILFPFSSAPLSLWERPGEGSMASLPNLHGLPTPPLHLLPPFQSSSLRDGVGGGPLSSSHPPFNLHSPPLPASHKTEVIPT